jgi:hypothetical protein
MSFHNLGQVFHSAPYVGGGILVWPYHGSFRPRESFFHAIWQVRKEMGNWDDGDDHQQFHEREPPIGRRGSPAHKTVTHDKVPLTGAHPEPAASERADEAGKARVPGSAGGSRPLC